MGDVPTGDQAEQVLEAALNEAGLKMDLQPGEGRILWSRQIEISLKDCMPGMECAYFTAGFHVAGPSGRAICAEDGATQDFGHVANRAISYGSFERFIGISIGTLPLAIFQPGLAPTQAAILNITDNQALLAPKWRKASNEWAYRGNCGLAETRKLALRFAKHTLHKIPISCFSRCIRSSNRTLCRAHAGGLKSGSMTVTEFSRVP